MAVSMSLFHAQSTTVGFHQRNHFAPCSVAKRNHVLLRTTTLGGPCMRAATSRANSTKLNSSRSFNNESMAENFSDNDDDYANCRVVEALEIRTGPDGCIIKLRSGNVLKCKLNNPKPAFRTAAPQPAIVLELVDDSTLLLPMIVLELPSVMLLEAVREVPIARPTVYQFMSKMLEKLGYRAKLVRVTKRVQETYFARAYLVKDGDDASAPPVSLDIRPSDAINLAVRCNIPIQVSKDLAIEDGVRIVRDHAKLPSSIVVNGQVITDMDKPLPGDCRYAKEFIILRNMLIAATEERFIDAAKLRDELQQFRTQNLSSQQEQT